MIILQGKYNTAKVFTDNIENEAISQIINLLNQEFVKESTIRIMPDTHAGGGNHFIEVDKDDIILKSAALPAAEKSTQWITIKQSRKS